MYWNSRMSREIARYLRRLQEEGLTERYIAQHRQSLSMFQAHCRERKIGTVHSVNTETALCFLERFKNLSASYQQKHWVVIKRFLAEYENPALIRCKPRVHGSARVNVDWLTPEECEAVFRTPMLPTESLMIGAGLLQGMRRVETLRLTRRDAKDALRSGILRVRGKGGKERGIPLHQDFALVLRHYLDSQEMVSEDSRLLDIGRTCSEETLGKFCQRHGRKFTFHTMRRTFGRNLWLLSVKMETISEILGHSSTDMTRKYLGINQTDMRQALACYRIASICTIPKKPER